MARDAALFLVLAAFVDGLFSVAHAGPEALLSTFYLAFFIHAGFTLYDGRFTALRTATWSTLIVAWVGAEIIGFLGYVLSWGQLKFWLASRLAAFPFANDILRFDGDTQAASFPLWPILLLCILCLDVAVMHHEAWRRRSLLHAGIFLMAAVVVVAAFGVIAGVLIGAPASPASAGDAFPPIIPSWYALPFYGILRSVPDKLAGVVVTFAAMAVPLIWPWVRVDALRTGRLCRVWLALCLALAATWIGLAWAGSRPPDPPYINAARALAVVYFAFFLIWPPVLRRLAVAAGRSADQA